MKKHIWITFNYQEIIQVTKKNNEMSNIKYQSMQEWHLWFNQIDNFYAISILR